MNPDQIHPTASKGSQFWLQHCIINYREHLDHVISEACGVSLPLDWKSPLPPRFTEFRDTAFLKALELEEFDGELSKFWPKQGPCWDGLAMSGKTRILIEAKANILEWISDGKASSPESIGQIQNSLNGAAAALKVNPHIDWNRGLFQFANRLAHQWFLQDRCGIKTKLVFLSFTGDTTHFPRSKDEFKGALEMAEALLGLGPRHRGRRYCHAYIDVSKIPIR